MHNFYNIHIQLTSLLWPMNVIFLFLVGTQFSRWKRRCVYDVIGDIQSTFGRSTNHRKMCVARSVQGSRGENSSSYCQPKLNIPCTCYTLIYSKLFIRLLNFKNFILKDKIPAYYLYSILFIFIMYLLLTYQYFYLWFRKFVTC